MNFSLPPHYIPAPAWVDRSAFLEDPPKRALLGSYIHLLALAWDREDKSTPVLREEDLYNTKDAGGKEIKGYMDVSRRQFYQVVSEMEGMRWLRSARPRVGFVQFFFHGSDPAVSAENRIVSAENRTALRIEEEESFINLNTESSSSSSLSDEPVRKIALVSENLEMRQLIDQLHLAFEPEVHGVLEWRPEFVAGIRPRVLGWIAKAYQDRERLGRGGGPLGLIVVHILKQDAPHRYFLNNYAKVLPEAFLEAIGEIEFECEYCAEHRSTRAALAQHVQEQHQNPCEECHPVRFFQSADELNAHYDETHDPYRIQKPTAPEIIPIPTLDGQIETLWQAVLGTLQQDMPHASFDTWVRDTQAVRYDGNTLTVSARNAYARDWLENRLTSTVERLLIGLLDQPKPKICFVVPGREVVA